MAMDSTNFDTFDSPAGGVELSDNLNDWRKKTNGIIQKITSLQAEVDSGDINDNAIVLEKLEQIANLKVLGNTSGSPANVSEISILDQDTLSSNSATALATQQSIKAYVDSLKFSKTYRLISATADRRTGSVGHSADDLAGCVTSATNLSPSNAGLPGTLADAGIYDSSTTSSPSSLDWSDILPMTFASNVEKTIMRCRWNWDVGGDRSEEMSFGTIIIDWENNKVFGSAISNYENEMHIVLPQATISSSATDYDFQDYAVVPSYSMDIRIGITGSSKTITKLPWVTMTGSNNASFHYFSPDEAQYEIENHIRG